MLRQFLLLVLQAAASATAVVAGKSWANESWHWRITTLVATAVALFNGCYALWTTSELNREKRKTDAHNQLNAMMQKILQRQRVDPGLVGLHLYMLKREWWPGSTKWFWKIPRPRFRKRQERLARLRLSNNPPASGIVWAEGKGVVGRSMANPGTAVRFLKSDYTAHVGCTEQAWAAVPPDETMGLSFSEWKITQRYEFIVAVPIQEGERYVGCITLDTTDASVAPRLDRPDITAILLDSAVSMATVVQGKP